MLARPTAHPRLPARREGWLRWGRKAVRMTESTTNQGGAGGLSPAFRTLVGLAAAVIALAGLYFARELVGPLGLGAVLVIIVHPLRHPLERRGWPRWLATAAVITVAYVIPAILVRLLFFAGRQFVRLIGDYADELQATAQNLVAWLQSVGFDQQAADAAAGVLDPSTLVG